jgi:DNA-binding response OmpR family regulator
MADARVAIAEPDADIAALLTLVVERLGHRPVVASDRSRPEDLDAFLLEPASSTGVALARELRRGRPGLPIVCISRLERSEEGVLLGPVRYLVKPVRLRELKTAVAEAVAAGRCGKG